jgi:hypothetical protein
MLNKRKPKSSNKNGKLKGNRLSWYGHVIRNEKNHVTRRVMNMNVEGRRGRGRSKKMDRLCEARYERVGCE